MTAGMMVTSDNLTVSTKSYYIPANSFHLLQSRGETEIEDYLNLYHKEKVDTLTLLSSTTNIPKISESSTSLKDKNQKAMGGLNPMCPVKHVFGWRSL